MIRLSQRLKPEYDDDDCLVPKFFLSFSKQKKKETKKNDEPTSQAVANLVSFKNPLCSAVCLYVSLLSSTLVFWVDFTVFQTNKKIETKKSIDIFNFFSFLLLFLFTFHHHHHHTHNRYYE